MISATSDIRFHESVAASSPDQVQQPPPVTTQVGDHITFKSVRTCVLLAPVFVTLPWCGRALDAECTHIAWGGFGVSRNFNNDVSVTLRLRFSPEP